MSHVLPTEAVGTPGHHNRTRRVNAQRRSVRRLALIGLLLFVSTLLAVIVALVVGAGAADGPTVVVPDIKVHVGEYKRITLGLRDSAPGRAYDFDLTFAPEGIALSQIQGSWPLMTTSYESCAELHSISAGGELRISAVCPTTRVRNGTLFALTVRGVLPGRSILMARDCAVGDVSPDAVPYDATVQCAAPTFGDVEVLP